MNDRNITVNEKERITISCLARGNPQPSIEWYHRNNTLDSNDYIIIHTSSTQSGLTHSGLIIAQSNYERDDGEYTCKGINNVTDLIDTINTRSITVNIQGLTELIRY